MDATGPTLLRRALAVLRAKQYLAFYAIPLYALYALVPLLLSWLHEGGSVADVVARAKAPLYDVIAQPGITGAVVVVLYLGVFTWFRAAYIRSLVGRFHLRPQDGAQFVSLLGLQLILEAVSAAGVWAVVAFDAPAAATAVGLAIFVFGVVVMYADYAIVISGIDPLRGMARSWTCVGANIVLSVFVALTVNLAGILALTALAGLLDGGLPQAIPLLVIEVMIMGVVSFAADVVLVVVYLNAVETGRLPRAH
jgi:hypothetical protein